MALARSAGPAAEATLPDIRLHHAEALWVLSELGFRGCRSAATFNEYIKSLRKLGIPFPRGEIGYAGRSMANYSYFHLMELALVLSFRVYHVVPDSLLTKIARHRKALYRHYRTAFEQRNSELGAPVTFNVTGSSPVRVRGVFSISNWISPAAPLCVSARRRCSPPPRPWPPSPTAKPSHGRCFPSI